MHAFVDESARRTYLVCAVLAGTDDLGRLRRTIQAYRLAGQRRVHFAKESDSRRRAVLAGFSGLDVRVRMYECGGPAVDARARCLRELVDDLVLLDVSRLTLEKLETQIRADRLTIRNQLLRHSRDGSGPPPPMEYEHRSAQEEPMLWVADAVAWAHGAGKDWRRRIAGLVDKVVHLGP